MAATATPTTTVREDAPDAPELRDPSPTAAEDPHAAGTSIGGFDHLFVQPVDPQDHDASLPDLPDGWRHAGLVAFLARQPQERRETILAGVFALVAVLWAPIGVLAFMTRNALLFGVLSVAAVILAVVPRPAMSVAAVEGAADRAGTALDRVGPALATARARLAPLAARFNDRLATSAARFGERLATMARRLGERLAPLAPRLRGVRDRSVVVMRDVGRRVAGRLRAADRSVSLTVRRVLEDLQDGGGDHSSPRSAR